MERFKIEISKMKTNKWGKILSSETKDPIYLSSIQEAKDKARDLSQKMPKWSINVYDLRGTGDETWCVIGFEKGIGYPNRHYQ